MVIIRDLLTLLGAVVIGYFLTIIFSTLYFFLNEQDNNNSRE